MILFSNSIKPMDPKLGTERIKKIGTVFVAATASVAIIYKFANMFKDVLNWTLMDAVEEENLELVKKAINRGADVNCLQVISCVWGSVTPLHVAVESGNAEIVKFLLTKDANLKIKNVDGDTPIDRAFQRGEIEIIKILVANMNQEELETVAKNDSHFLGLIVHNDLFLAKLFITNGANVNAYYHVDYRFFRDALYYALKNNNLELMELLLDKGAQLNRICYPDFQNIYPRMEDQKFNLLELAEKYNETNALNLLLKYCDSKIINDFFGQNPEKLKFWTEKLQDHRKRFKEQINHFTQNRTFADIAVDYLCADNANRSATT